MLYYDIIYIINIIIIFVCLVPVAIIYNVTLNNYLDHQYFHPYPRGYHAVWKTLLFNYTSLEVLRFLLSNLRYWIEEYHFDGFRFDGVTSMLYKHHGIGGTEFTGNYEEYFSDATDLESLSYVMVVSIYILLIYNKFHIFIINIIYINYYY